MGRGNRPAPFVSGFGTHVGLLTAHLNEGEGLVEPLLEARSRGWSVGGSSTAVRASRTR
jgi:hypothetical protein